MTGSSDVCSSDLLDCHPCHAGASQDEVELLVPVRSEGRVTHLLVIVPGPARRGLVTHEVNYLRSVAAQFGHRLDALHMEELLIVAQSRSEEHTSELQS